MLAIIKFSLLPIQTELWFLKQRLTNLRIERSNNLNMNSWMFTCIICSLLMRTELRGRNTMVTLSPTKVLGPRDGMLVKHEEISSSFVLTLNEASFIVWC